jgi:hypothetical protein
VDLGRALFTLTLTLTPHPHVWSWLNNFVQGQQPKNKVGLEQGIDDACDAIPQKVIQSYILHILTVM